MQFIKNLFLGYSFFCFLAGLILGMYLCISYPLQTVKLNDTTGQFTVWVKKQDINKTNEIKVNMVR